MAMPVEFRSARWHSILLLGFAALWAAVGIGLIHDEVWMPVLFFVFATISAFVGSTNLVHPAIIRLDGDGVQFRHWRMAWFVAWRDIADVRLFTVRINGFRTSVNVIVRERNGRDRRISSGLTITQPALAALILRWRDANRGNGQ